MGMDIANYLYLRMGYINRGTFEYMHQMLYKNIPNFDFEKHNMKDYFKALSKDKKNIGANLGCILTHGPGSMMKIHLPMDDKFKDMVISYFKNKDFNYEQNGKN